MILYSGLHDTNRFYSEYQKYFNTIGDIGNGNKLIIFRQYIYVNK